jgi:hypothetical protein
MQGEKVRSLGGEEGRGDLKRTARSEREELSIWLNPKFKAIIKLKKGGKNCFYIKLPPHYPLLITYITDHYQGTLPDYHPSLITYKKGTRLSPYPCVRY